MTLSLTKTLGMSCMSLLLGACASQEHHLIASTGTTIGVDVSQAQGTQAPTATLGYKRAELAIVPTNRTFCAEKEDGSVECAEQSGEHKGAADTGNVIMELRYGGIFTYGSDNAIYQRLAVGDKAVQAKGAAYMFARNNEGDIEQSTANAISTSETIDIQRRNAETYTKERRQRIDGLLEQINSLSDSDAIAIEKNPPSTSDDADNTVKKQDPSNARASNGDDARKSLRTRTIYIGRDDASMQAWESVIGAALSAP